MFWQKKQVITVEFLRKIHACEPEIELFQQVFGESAEINRKNFQIANDHDFSIVWFIEHALPVELNDKFDLEWNKAYYRKGYSKAIDRVNYRFIKQIVLY